MMAPYPLPYAKPALHEPARNKASDNGPLHKFATPLPADKHANIMPRCSAIVLAFLRHDKGSLGKQLSLLLLCKASAYTIDSAYTRIIKPF